MKHVSVSIGLIHRKIENTLVSDSVENTLGRINIYFGNCNTAHQLCFIQCIEDLLNYKISDFQANLRIIMLELERGTNHLLWMIMVLFDLGHLDIANLLIEIRKELLMARSEILGKNKISSWIVRPIYPEEDMDNIIRNLRNSLDSLNTLFESNQLNTVYRYLNQAFNPIPIEVNEYGLVGPLARSYGFKHDLRDKQSIYDKIVDPSSEYPKNIFDVKLVESISSIAVVLSIIESKPFTDQEICDYSYPLKINSYSLYSIEAPNGRLTYLVHSDNNGVIDHIRVSIPSVVNISSLSYFVKNKKLKWFPVISRIYDMGIDPLDYIQIQDESGQSFTPSAFTFRKIAQEAILQDREINLTQE